MEESILDTVGLVSPESLLYYPVENLFRHGTVYGVPGDLLRTQRPDYIVSLEVFLRSVLRDDPGALDGYQLIKKGPSNAFRSDGMLVYRKAGVVRR